MTRPLLLLAVCAACSTAPPPPVAGPPLGISMLPAQIDYEALLPPAPPESVLEVKGPKFDTIPLDAGKYCLQGTATCLALQPGFVVDETTLAQSISDRSTVRRLRVETRVQRDLRAKERTAVLTAERAYQDRIVSLQRENEVLRTPSLWSEIKPYAGFFLGAVLASAVAYGAAHAVR